LATDVREELCLQLHDAFVSAEHFLFPVAQLGRGETFGIRECLASLILDRHARRIRFRDFNEVSEHAIKPDPEISDSTARAFSGFERCDDLFRVPTN